MDIKQIQELIKLVNKSNIGELSIEQDNFKITIKQKEENVPAQHVYVPQPQATALPQSPVQAGQQQASDASAQETPSKTDGNDKNLITIKSPMIGTFYRQSGPGKPLFVNVGDQITPGKVVCIIEAMKLFNEIESEVSGKIVKILVDDASPVEFDQPLFLVEPA